MTWRWPGTPPRRAPRTFVQEPVSGASGSLWKPAQQSDGSWQFQNSNSGLCLDVYGDGSNTGQQLDQWTCKNAPNQPGLTPR